MSKITLSSEGIESQQQSYLTADGRDVRSMKIRQEMWIREGGNWIPVIFRSETEGVYNFVSPPLDVATGTSELYYLSTSKPANLSFTNPTDGVVMATPEQVASSDVRKSVRDPMCVRSFRGLNEKIRSQIEILLALGIRGPLPSALDVIASFSIPQTENKTSHAIGASVFVRTADGWCSATVEQAAKNCMVLCDIPALGKKKQIHNLNLNISLPAGARALRTQEQKKALDGLRAAQACGVSDEELRSLIIAVLGEE